MEAHAREELESSGEVVGFEKAGKEGVVGEGVRMAMGLKNLHDFESFGDLARREEGGEEFGGEDEVWLVAFGG